MKMTDRCILYRDFEQGEILEAMTELMEDITHPKVLSGKEGQYFFCVHQMVEMAGAYGFSGNLWHNYLTFLLVNKENAFSTACEIVGPVEGSINALAVHDFSIFKELFDFDFSRFEEVYPSLDVRLITDYRNINEGSKVFNKRIGTGSVSWPCGWGRRRMLRNSWPIWCSFYKEFGVGKLGLHKAFRVDGTVSPARIVPITNIAHVQLEDLVGYETAKKKLIENTEAFVAGRPANNCLLFGDAGTGKSSSIKGILNRYYEQGLRIIEVYKHQFKDLNDIIAQIKNRNYRFIIYMDDLSFEEFEIEYKYLKAVIEGGLERKPDNILIYATSNRRHLVREQFSDKEGRRDDLHASDTVQEKLSLVYRFGVTIFFCAPDKKQFQNIVRVLAERYGIKMPEEELMLEANRWELNHGGLSGRTAQQFIDYIRGKEKQEYREQEESER